MHKIAIKSQIFSGGGPPDPLDRLIAISPLHLYTSCTGLGVVRPRKMSKLVSYSVEMVSYWSYLRKTLLFLSVHFLYLIFHASLTRWAIL